MKINLTIQEELNTIFKDVDEWVNVERAEHEFVLTSLAPARLFDLTQFNQIKSIIVKTDQPLSAEITKDSVTSTLSIEGVFVYSPSSIDVSLLESLQLTAINSTDTNVEVFIYGV
jgi:hypothetical protein